MERKVSMKGLNFELLFIAAFLIFIVDSKTSILQSFAIKNGQLNLGVGKHDITGPAAEVGFVGFGEAGQTGVGVENRLYARAFVIKHEEEFMAHVVCDLAFMTRAVRQGVLQRVKTHKKLKAFLMEDNLVLSSIHTHTGPGGYAGFLIQDISAKGFIKDNYRNIVNGIIKALEKAYSNLEPGKIELKFGSIKGLGTNRSPEAYMKDKDASKFKFNKNRLMSILQFITNNGKKLGALVYYGIHPTSHTKHFRHISGDNVGFAEFFIEEYYGDEFVCGFIQTSHGDISPNPHYDSPNESKDIDINPKLNLPENSKVVITAKNLFMSAVNIMEKAKSKVVTSPIQASLKYVDFSKIKLDNKKHTCNSAIGLNMFSGTEDGRGLSYIDEGQKKSNWFLRTIGYLIHPYNRQQSKCQNPKKIGLLGGHSLTPEILPLQIQRLGSLVIANTPFEITTMSWRRIRSALLEHLKSEDITHVIITSIVNDYGSYLSTPEEYNMQHYEGASTQFGMNQHEATIQELKKIADIVFKKKEWNRFPLPKFIDVKSAFSLQTGVVFDTARKKYGTAKTQPRSSYKAGEQASATFWGSHPRNQFRKLNSFCELQYKENSKGKTGGKWVVYRTDDHPNLIFTWKRKFISESLWICQYTIPTGLAGEFRFRASGYYKNLIRRPKYVAWEGTSNSFTVGDAKNPVLVTVAEEFNLKDKLSKAEKNVELNVDLESPE